MTIVDGPPTEVQTFDSEDLAARLMVASQLVSCAPKRIGLLTEKIRPKFEALGVRQFENLKHDGQIDWATLEAPLMRGDEVIAA